MRGVLGATTAWSTRPGSSPSPKIRSALVTRIIRAAANPSASSQRVATAALAVSLSRGMRGHHLLACTLHIHRDREHADGGEPGMVTAVGAPPPTTLISRGAKLDKRAFGRTPVPPDGPTRACGREGNGRARTLVIADWLLVLRLGHARARAASQSQPIRRWPADEKDGRVVPAASPPEYPFHCPWPRAFRAVLVRAAGESFFVDGNPGESAKPGRHHALT